MVWVAHLALGTAEVQDRKKAPSQASGARARGRRQVALAHGLHLRAPPTAGGCSHLPLRTFLSGHGALGGLLGLPGEQGGGSGSPLVFLLLLRPPRLRGWRRGRPRSTVLALRAGPAGLRVWPPWRAHRQLHWARPAQPGDGGGRRRPAGGLGGQRRLAHPRHSARSLVGLGSRGPATGRGVPRRQRRGCAGSWGSVLAGRWGRAARPRHTLCRLLNLGRCPPARAVRGAARPFLPLLLWLLVAVEA